jgi:hypothetical protein
MCRQRCAWDVVVEREAKQRGCVCGPCVAVARLTPRAPQQRWHEWVGPACVTEHSSRRIRLRAWRSALGRLRSAAALCEHTHRDQCHRDSRPLAPPLLRAPPPPLSSHGGHGTVPAGVIRAGAGRPAQPRPLLQGRAPQCTSTPSAHLRALRALRAPPPPMSRRLSTARRPHRLTPDA